MGAGKVKDPLFREISIWRRWESGSVTRYTCFQRLDTMQFGVHSSEKYASAKQAHGDSDDRTALLLELFIETSPIERCEWFEALELAVQAHDAAFA